MVGLLVGLAIGMIVGRFFRAGRDCPRTIMGYNCKGDKCDHSDSIYYEAKMHDALNRERDNFNGLH